MATLNVKPQAIQRLKSLLNDNLYKEAVEHSASYNTRLCIERKMRLPFLDAQTGVAQSNCYLWMNRRNRMPGEKPGQVYTYPSKRWRKRRRQYLANFLRPRARDYEIGHESEPNQGISIENALKSHGDDERDDRLADDSKDSWYRDYDDIPDPPDAGELDDPESDYDDYEESYSKRKKKKGSTRGKKRSMGFDPATEAEKPYQCDICGARYKTRPGLSYHYSHSHINNSDAADDDSIVSASPKASTTAASNVNTSNDAFTEYPVPQKGPNKLISTPTIVLSPITNPVPAPAPPPPVATTSAAMPMIPPPATAIPVPPTTDVPPVAPTSKTNASPSPYCDFCLGDSIENKKTRQAEELVSCSDCGRSGHPSCLQFTANMIISVKKYRWQCIECKCCTLCGNSDNDEQLLFCDDCDRGYHMYCLNPPLIEPPEGSWSCSLCIEEFHKK